MSDLTLVTPDQAVNPHYKAYRDLRKRADVLRQMSTVCKPGGLTLALHWFDELYIFERNLNRWPDGEYYLVNRAYKLWGHHRISFTREELERIDGLMQWSALRIHPASSLLAVQLQSDTFMNRPAPRYLKRFASVVSAISDSWLQKHPL